MSFQDSWWNIIKFGDPIAATVFKLTCG